MSKTLKNPKTIALTGSRMSGKNKVSKLWSEIFKIPIFDADLAFRFSIHYDEEIRSSIRKEFGSTAFIKDWLNSSFFDNDVRMKKLLEISEERVFDLFFKWRNRQDSNYVIFKCSVIHELMNPYNFNKIINVYTPKAMRDNRYDILNGYGSSCVLNNEFPDTDKNKKSDYVVHNYTSSEYSTTLNKQIYKIHRKIIKEIP